MSSLYRLLARSARRFRRSPNWVRSLRKPPRPFFTTLHDLLDQHPVISLGDLLEKAGEQSYGLAVLILALLTFIPGVANVLSLATLLVGLFMMWGVPSPWLPKALKSYQVHRGRVKDQLAKVEARLTWLAKRRGPRKSPGRILVGFLVAWTAFLAAIPIPLPFANVLPAVSLVLVGVALLEEWPTPAWIGAALSVGSTVYFAMSFELTWKAVKALFHGMAG